MVSKSGSRWHGRPPTALAEALHPQRNPIPFLKERDNYGNKKTFRCQYFADAAISR